MESSLHTLLVAMSGKPSGCLEQPLFERYAYNLNTLPKRSIGALPRQTQHVAKFQ